MGQTRVSLSRSDAPWPVTGARSLVGKALHSVSLAHGRRFVDSSHVVLDTRQDAGSLSGFGDRRGHALPLWVPRFQEPAASDT